jgi:XTP/dITP diphosphohydrolase
MLGRLERAGVLDDAALAAAAAGDPWAQELLALLRRARAEGVDAESSLRSALTRLTEAETAHVGALPADRQRHDTTD